MALVNVTNVIVLDNPTVFTNPFQFEVEFECLGELEDDLEWRVVYVGSAEDQSFDQVLEEVMVGPVPVGVSKFVLQADAPDSSKVPQTDIVGITVVLITCSYREKEFVRIGYYVNNEYYHSSPLQPTLPHPALLADHTSPATPLGGQVSEAVAAANVPQPVGPEELQELLASGQQLDISHVFRNIMSEKPRVTRFQIDWTPTAQLATGGGPAPSQQDKMDVAMEHCPMEM